MLVRTLLATVTLAGLLVFDPVAGVRKQPQEASLASLQVSWQYPFEELIKQLTRIDIDELISDLNPVARCKEIAQEIFQKIMDSWNKAHHHFAELRHLHARIEEKIETNGLQPLFDTELNAEDVKILLQWTTAQAALDVIKGMHSEAELGLFGTLINVIVECLQKIVKALNKVMHVVGQVSAWTSWDLSENVVMQMVHKSKEIASNFVEVDGNLQRTEDLLKPKLEVVIDAADGVDEASFAGVKDWFNDVQKAWHVKDDMVRGASELRSEWGVMKRLIEEAEELKTQMTGMLDKVSLKIGAR